MMNVEIELDGITIEVVRARVKHVRLSVNRTGRVRISAPHRVPMETVRAFAASKAHWITRHLESVRARARDAQRDYVNGESLYVWGRPYVLEVIEQFAVPGVQCRHDALQLRVRPGADCARRASVVSGWYRQMMMAEVPPLIGAWEPRLQVSVSGFSVRQMKTRWGSCNVGTRAIRLNTELARKPRECLEYVVVHEMVHLLEPSHNDRFKGLLDRFMPRWRHIRTELNDGSHRIAG